MRISTLRRLVSPAITSKSLCGGTLQLQGTTRRLEGSIANTGIGTTADPSPAVEPPTTPPPPPPPKTSPEPAAFPSISLLGANYPTDSWTNINSTITSHLSRNLHLEQNHPISITRALIESRFPQPIYTAYNDLSPIVSTNQNFDSLGFPHDHPGRSRTDTYYVNATTVLRTHTSAHQLDVFRKNASPGFLISADVYRRDAIDRSHYPVFHQMEGARGWNLATTTLAEINEETEYLASISKGLQVKDDNPTFHEQRNPLQPMHSPNAVEAAANHLKRSVEHVVLALFGSTHATTTTGGNIPKLEETLEVRWIEAYFPFTSPSWELEVFWQGSWLELLGCGIVQQEITRSAGQPETQISWAVGLGLERIAMVLFGIPDIRLFWSTDHRFLNQFSSGKVVKFKEFSKHPSCYKDISFWLPSIGIDADTGGRSRSSVGVKGAESVHEHDVMEVIRCNAGDMVEDVMLVSSNELAPLHV